jgi:hypothetical protein
MLLIMGKMHTAFGLQVIYQYQKRWLVVVPEWSRRIPAFVSLFVHEKKLLLYDIFLVKMHANLSKLSRISYP